MQEELRGYFRVNMLAPLFVRPLHGITAEKYHCRLNAQGFDDYLKRSLYKKINISGSGIGFESDQPYAPGGILEVRFMLDDVHLGLIDLCIEVLRVDMRPKGYWVAGRYVGMVEDVRQLILQFISQRENRSKKKAPGRMP
jgi:hypothetical protein